MKSIVIILTLFLFSVSLIAQDEDVENDDSAGVSGYISPLFETTNMVKQSFFVGGSGAIFINQNFFLGGFGVVMINYFKTDRGKFSGNELDLGGGGLIGGYSLFPSKKIHPILTIWAGGGSISLSDKDKTRIKEAYDDFLYLNGTIEIEYRIIKNLAIGMGVHYQKLSGLKLDGYSENDFCGLGFYANIKVGLF